MFLFISMFNSLSAITFTEDTLIEISPAISAVACWDIGLGFGEGCNLGIEKKIIFGLVHVYPSKEDRDRLLDSRIPLIVFDDLKLRGTGGKTWNGESWTVLSQLYPDGSERQEVALLQYDLDIDSGELSSLRIVIDDKEYNLEFIDKYLKNKKVLKLSGKALSGNLIASKDLLTLGINVEPDANIIASEEIQSLNSNEIEEYLGDIEVKLEQNYDIQNNIYTLIGKEVMFTYTLIGLGNRIAILNYGDGTTKEIKSILGGGEIYTYSKEGTYSPYIQITDGLGNEILTHHSKQVVVWKERPF